jgi:hypothetical protein
MFERGDIVIFRIHDLTKYGPLTVGIVRSTHNHIEILGGKTCGKKQICKLSIRIVGSFDPSQNYPDSIDLLLKNKCSCSDSRCFHRLRRETTLPLIEDLKQQADSNIDIGQICCNETTDLVIMIASKLLWTERHGLDGLYIDGMKNSLHVHQPSNFHSKIQQAKATLHGHNTRVLSLNHFTNWQDSIFVIHQQRKEASITIQKNVRRFCERHTLDRQRNWKQWWEVQKHYLFSYVSTQDRSQCYHVKGNTHSFSTKLTSEKWRNHMKRVTEGIIARTAQTSVRFRCKSAICGWRDFVSRQNLEMKFMLHEDFLSYQTLQNFNS